MRVKKSLLMMFMFMFVLLGAVAVKNDNAKADENPYYIKVNKSTNVVTVYKADGTAYKAFVCSTGNATPTGTYYTSQKLRWHVLMGPSYGQYCTRIVNGILFHSVWYYNNGDKASQSTVQYNNLGTTASHGCVRLTVADCKWIYDNCPVGTKVVIFNGNSKDDPLGKPEAIKVSTASRMGWDPTDPDSANPYLKKEPTIKTTKDTYSVNANTTVNLKELATARAAYGPYLDSYLMIYVKVPGAKGYTKLTTPTYRFVKVGKYTVMYRVKDPKNSKTVSKTVEYTVNDTGKPVIAGTGSNRTISYNTKLNLRKNVTVKTASGTDLKKYLVVKIKTPSNTTVTLNSNEYTFNKVGTYVVTYTAKNPANSTTATKKINIIVKDTKAPTFSGISTATGEYKGSFNVKTGVTAKATTGTSLTGRIKISVKDPSGKSVSISNNVIKLNARGNYKITYTVTGFNGMTTTKVRTLRSIDTSAPVLSGVPTSTTAVGYKQSVDLRSGVKAATSKGTILTSKIVISVTNPNNVTTTLDNNVKSITFNMVGAYVVKYTVTNPNGGKKVTKSCKYYAKYTPVITVDANVTQDIVDGPVLTYVDTNYTCYNKYGTNIKLEKYVPISVVHVKPCNNNIAETVTLDGNKFIADQPGVYKITYTAQGTNVVTTRKTKFITVIDSSTGYTVTPVSEDELTTGMEYDFTKAIKVKTAAGSDMTLAVQLSEIYYINDNDEKVNVELVDGKATFDQAGSYVAVYKRKSAGQKYYTGIDTVEYSFDVISSEPQPEPDNDPELEPEPEPASES